MLALQNKNAHLREGYAGMLHFSRLLVLSTTWMLVESMRSPAFVQWKPVGSKLLFHRLYGLHGNQFLFFDINRSSPHGCVAAVQRRELRGIGGRCEFNAPHGVKIRMHSAQGLNSDNEEKVDGAPKHDSISQYQKFSGALLDVENCGSVDERKSTKMNSEIGEGVVITENDLNSSVTRTRANNKQLREHPAPKIESSTGKFNVVLTHSTADFDTLASAVGLARLWSSPRSKESKIDGIASKTKLGGNHFNKSASVGGQTDVIQFDDYDMSKIPTYVVLPRGAHPTVQRFLALHKHLFPIRSLRSLPADLSGLMRLGLVDAQRRDRIGPAEHLLGFAKNVTIVDHHIDGDSDIPEATDYVVDEVGSVSTMMVERLRTADIEITEAEATLLALGIHADTGNLCYDNTTPRDAQALAWVLGRGASQAAIAEHAQSNLSPEQQGVLTQALINTNSSIVHGVTISTVLLSSQGFINGLAAVAQDALELSSSDILLLALVYDAKSGSSKKGKLRRGETKRFKSLMMHDKSNPVSTISHEMQAGAWKGGEEALKRRRLRAAFERRDADGSGFLERDEISSALASSGVIVSDDAVEAVIQEIDEDGDGRIDFDEFVVFASEAEKMQKAQDTLTGHRASTMIIIGRVKTGVNVRSVSLNKLFQQFGGGGHSKAASATVRLEDEGEAGKILQRVVDELIQTSLLEQATVGDFMTAPVLSAKPSMTAKQVEGLFSRYDVRALPVVDDDDNVIGLVTYKEVAAAKQRLWNKEQKRLKRTAVSDARNEYDGQKNLKKNSSALKGWMKQHVRVVEASMKMAEVEAVLLDNDVGCIPVVADNTRKLIGLVTRTDLLRQHRYYPSLHYHNKGFSDSIAARKPIIELRKRLKRFDLEDE